MKTIAELQERWWYRAILIIYLTGVICNFLFITFLLVLSVPIDFSIAFVLVSMVMHLLIYGWFFPGVFYYIVLGKFNPPLN